MGFELTPSSEVDEQTTTEISTDTGGINVDLKWEPNPLSAETESRVTATFSDAFSGARFDGFNVMYNLRILDMNNTEVYASQDLTANGGTDTQTIDFPRNENYRIEIRVTGLAEEGRPVDMTRNGVARGLVVVPEFPVLPLVVLMAAIASVMAIQRSRIGRGFSKGPD
jgi:predicted secreted protein with PEFG-CTERM motif